MRRIAKRGPPDEIYLQWYGDSDLTDVDGSIVVDVNEVSWCTDQIFDNDIRYKRMKSKKRPARKKAKGLK